MVNVRVATVPSSPSARSKDQQEKEKSVKPRIVWLFCLFKKDNDHDMIQGVRTTTCWAEGSGS